MGPKFSKTDFIFLFIGAVLFIYIFIKASVSSFTHDESFTYLQFIHISFLDILTFKSGNANNHILNTLLMKYSEQLFGSSEIALRLPNLLLFLVYMTYSFLLFRSTNWLLAVSIFVLLVTNISVNDFFGLARGYGLSFGFMLMSLYHFIQSFYNNKIRNVILFHVAALLAVLSNFTLIDFYLALILIYFLLYLIDSRFITHQKYQLLNSAKVHIILIVLSTIVLYLPVSRIIANGSLNVGGKDGFYADTVAYLIRYILQELRFSPIVYHIVKVIFTGIVLIPFAIIFQKILSRNELFFSKYKGLIITDFLLIFISIAIILQHFIINADYPKLRFSLFLLPLFVIHFGFLLAYLSDLNNKKVVLSIAVGLALASCTGLAIKADLHKCSEWEYDMHTKKMLLDLEEYHSKNVSDSSKIKLGVNWLFEPTVNFYRQTRNMEWLLPAEREGISPKDNFYYLFNDELNNLDPDSYKILTEYKIYKTKTLLLENKNPEVQQSLINTNH